MEENSKGLPIVSEATVKAQLNIALTAQSIGIQALQKAADSLIFNEDGLKDISEFIATGKKAIKIVETVFKEGKAPYFEAGKVWDAGKNSTIALLEGVINPVNAKFQKLAAEIEQRRLAAERAAAAEKAILEGIEANNILFAQKIAAANTGEELLAVERLINLEKSESRKAKYGDHHGTAIARYDEVLLPILKAQKEKIKQKEELEAKIKAAEQENNAEKIDELEAQKEKIDNEILQNQVNVQQSALDNIMSFEITPVEQIFPATSGRTRFVFEIVDLAVAVKKCPELLNIEIKHRETEKVAIAFRDAGVFEGKTETVVNGIKFSIDKTYK